MKRFMRGTIWIVAMALAAFLASCEGTETTQSETSKTKVTFKCLSSSCDAAVMYDEGDPIPEHCGKRMIR